MTSRDYIEGTAREVEEWPGASFRIEHAGKHLVAILRFGRRERKVFFAKSPSDNGHGLKNHIGIVRQELRAMGATKRQAVIAAFCKASPKAREIEAIKRERGL